MELLLYGECNGTARACANSEFQVLFFDLFRASGNEAMIWLPMTPFLTPLEVQSHTCGFYINCYLLMA